MKLRTSGKFGHTFATSENLDETSPYHPSHQDVHCFLCYLFYSNNYNGNKQRRCPNLIDVRSYPTLP